MGQGVALIALTNFSTVLRRSVLLIAVTMTPWAVSRVYACACCVNNAIYGAGQGVDNYKLNEIRKLTSAWTAQLGAGVGESGIAMAEPKAVVQQELGSKTLAWRIVLSEKDALSGKTLKVTLRFTPEPAKKWFYIAHTAPLQNTSEHGGIAHDFVMQGKLTVLSDPEKLMHNIRSMTGQLVLYAKGNQCFSGQDFFAFMLDISLRAKDNADGQLVGQGRIAP
jgi:hypothetical protein